MPRFSSYAYVTHTTAATSEQFLDAVDTGRCSMFDKCRKAYVEQRETLISSLQTSVQTTKLCSSQLANYQATRIAILASNHSANTLQELFKSVTSTQACTAIAYIHGAADPDHAYVTYTIAAALVQLLYVMELVVVDVFD
eukprot:9554-Heterococcus_DN1.PRE.9